jgi:hypothetical protein
MSSRISSTYVAIEIGRLRSVPPIRSGRACPVPYYFAGALLLLGKRRRSVHEP